jgi:hypothetical protein
MTASFCILSKIILPLVAIFCTEVKVKFSLEQAMKAQRGE